MSTTVSSAPAVARGTVPVRRRLGPSVARWDMARVRRIGLVVLALQLCVLLAWGVVRADRFALTWDFSIYYQAWWLIAHGTLNPFDTLNGIPYWSNHGEFLLWPLSVIGRVWPSPLVLLSVQALGLIATESVAFSWLCDIVEDALGGSGNAPGERRFSERLGSAIAIGGLVLLVADPWTYWADSFDFHLELIGILFVLLVARQIYRDPTSRRVWVWVAFGLLSGDVVATYLVGVGVCAALAGGRWRRTGLLVAAIAMCWTVVLAVAHANRGSGVATGYGYLAVGAGAAAPAQLGLPQLAEGVVRHPIRVVQVLWERRLDVYGSVAAGGVLGAVSPWVVGLTVIVLAENVLNQYAGFAVPGFQGVLLYVMLPVGTVHVLTVLAGRWRRLAMLLTAVITACAVGWGVIWIPRTGSQWLRVSARAASVLSVVESRIPPSAEVVVSQGVGGRFSGRRWVYEVQGPGRFPVHARPVWVVVAPGEGIETASVDASDGLVAELAGPLHARLVAHRSGIWAFRWVPPPGTHYLVVPAQPPTLGAWSSTGAAGKVMLAGPEADWRAVATGTAGYVVSNDYWTERPGHYRATVTLSTTVPVNVEVWNATGNVLLARRSIPASSGMEAVTLPVDATHRYVDRAYAGAAPFVISPLEPTPDNRLEIRVWTPGSGVVSVASLELVRAGR